MKYLLTVFGCFCYFSVLSQSHSIGIGIGTTGYNDYVLAVNDTVFIGIDPNGDPDLSIHYVFEPEIRDFLHLRLGLDYYRIYHSFWVAGVREPFGLIKKGAVVGASNFFIPAQLGIHFGRVKLYGGGGISIAMHSKPMRQRFIDTPEVEDIHFKLEGLVKPIQFHYMATFSIQALKRLEIQGQYVEAMGSITKNLRHGGEELTVSTRFARASIGLLYKFEPKKIKAHFKKR